MRHLKSFFPILFLVLFTISCSSPGKKMHLKKGKVIIIGQLKAKSVKNEFAEISGTSLLNLGKLDKISFCDSKGRFRFEFQLLTPQIISLRYNSENYSLFVKPNDSLYVTINAENSDKDAPTLQINGSTAGISNDLIKFSHFKKSHNFKFALASMDVSTEKLHKELSIMVHYNDSLIDVFAKQYRPGKETLNYIRNDLRYDIGNDQQISYLVYHDMKKIPVKGELFDLKTFPVDDDPAIVSATYIAYLWNYATTRYLRNDTVFNNLRKEGKEIEATRYALQKIRASEKPGLSRDIMYYQILGSSYRFAFKRFRVLMQSPWVYKGNKILFGELQKKLKDHPNGGVSGIVRFSGKEREVTGNFYHDLIHRYHGKVIYLDFWETTCGPCLAQIPNEIKLHEFLKGKPVVLVPVCLNSSKEDWLKMVKNMHIPGENYYLSPRQSVVMSNALKINGFPTYMIIDKKGNLVNRNAPRPQNSKKIKSELMKYMKE